MLIFNIPNHVIMRKLIVLSCAVLLSFFAHAQDPHFSQFFASPLTLNPAFTGKFDGQLRLAANHRDQWPSIPKAYVTTSASLDFSILRNKIPEGDVFGIGFSGLSDQSADAALKLNYGSFSMSYHKALDEDGYNTIGAGFQATYSSAILDFTKLTFEDQLTQNGFTGTTAETLSNGSNQNYLDMYAGILFSGSSDGTNNYYLGASVYHINRPNLSFIDKVWNLSPRFTAHGGGSFPGTIARIEHGFNVRPDLCAIDNNNSPRSYLGKFWIDSLVHDERILDYLIDLVGAEKIALGSDYPFPLGEDVPGKLIEHMPYSDPTKEWLLYKSAMAWMGRQ